MAAQERQWDHDDKCVRRRAELTPRRRPCRRRAVQREPWECSRVAGAVRRRRHRTVGPIRSSTHERPQRRAETLPRLEHALEEITVAVEPVPHHLLGVARRIEALGDLVPVERRRDGRVRHRPDRIHRSPFADPDLRPVRLVEIREAHDALALPDLARHGPPGCAHTVPLPGRPVALAHARTLAGSTAPEASVTVSLADDPRRLPVRVTRARVALPPVDHQAQRGRSHF